jgi:hypothetical protein
VRRLETRTFELYRRARLLIPVGAVTVLVVAAAAGVAAQTARSGRGRGAPPSTTIQCAAELGKGTTTARQFCDVIVGTKAADSIAISIPPHRGPAKLMFDLHNRVAVPPESGLPAQTFSRNTAIVTVMGPKNELGRGAAVSEFRTAADLYDRIAGTVAGAVKGVAPGPPTPIQVTVPAGVTAVGIVGTRLDVLTKLGKQTYETPGRPIAIVSNVHVEYTPLR